MRKVRGKIISPVTTLKISGKMSGMPKITRSSDSKNQRKAHAGKLRFAFAAFDKSRNKGPLLIDEAQLLADKSLRSIARALRACWIRVKVVCNPTGALDSLQIPRGHACVEFCA